jgi:hypothetical protein
VAQRDGRRADPMALRRAVQCCRPSGAEAEEALT